MTKGAITTYALVFGSIFLILIGGLFNFILMQVRFLDDRQAENEALHYAEAGVDYYRWHLAHAPSDFCDGVAPGQGNCIVSPYGPFEHGFKNPGRTVVGKFSLMISPATNCSPGVEIESTGWSLAFPGSQRKVKAVYAKPSLVKYGFLTKSNVWFGPDEELKGPFHSNGGIRMDGTQNSMASSAKQTYICTAEHGCSESKCGSPCTWTDDGCECPGIWCCEEDWCVYEGKCEAEGEGLWDFPAPAVDFDKITQDLAVLEQEAVGANLYFGSSGCFGYHVEFLPGGSFNLYRVTALKDDVWGWDGEDWTEESNSIDQKDLIDNFLLPEGCEPIFLEDDVWVSGDVKGRVTVVAAKLPETELTMKKIIIHNNINYVEEDSLLGLIAQKDILIPLYSPDRLEIKAALLAQKGHVFRYYYPEWDDEPYNTYAVRDYIETYGSIITNTVWTFTWVDEGGNIVSGYRETEMSYNPDLSFCPPPYFPVSGEYEFVKWDEVE